MRRVIKRLSLWILVLAAGSASGCANEETGDIATGNLEQSAELPPVKTPIEIINFSGNFEAVEDAPLDFANVEGRISVTSAFFVSAVGAGLTGFPPTAELVGHIHVLSCEEGSGGHYQHIPGGSTSSPENEVHLKFEESNTYASGGGYFIPRPDEVKSIVVHEVLRNASGEVTSKPKRACATLTRYDRFPFPDPVVPRPPQDPGHRPDDDFGREIGPIGIY